MAKRSASDAGLESAPSKPVVANTVESASAVDRQHLLDIISSWEQQNAGSQDSDPGIFERSKNMFKMLRDHLDDPTDTERLMPLYSDEEAKLLEKVMTTKTSLN